MQFPQPTRPINNYDMESLQLPQELSMSQPTNMDDCESCFPAETEFELDPIQSHDKCKVTSIEEGKTLEEVLKVIRELYEKLPESVRSQVNLDKLINDHFQGNNLKALKDDKTRKRSVNGPLDELQQKLERFKIRTVQLGGVVINQEDDEKR